MHPEQAPFSLHPDQTLPVCTDEASAPASLAVSNCRLLVCPGGSASDLRWRDAIWLLGQTNILQRNLRLLLVGPPLSRSLTVFAEEIEVLDQIRVIDPFTAERVFTRPFVLLDLRERGPAASFTQQALARGVPFVLSDIPAHRDLAAKGPGFWIKPGNVSDCHRKLAVLLAPVPAL